MKRLPVSQLGMQAAPFFAAKTRCIFSKLRYNGTVKSIHAALFGESGCFLERKESRMLKLKDGRPILRAMLTLAIPISLQNLITFAVSFADNLMIGSLGDTAISAVYMGTQVQTFLQMVVNGVAMGMLVIVAQYWGKQDLERIRVVAGIAMRIVLVLGVAVTILSVGFPREILTLLTPGEKSVVDAAIPYLQIVGCSYLFFCVSQVLIAMLRGVENAKIGMYVSFGSLISNVFLNWVLIFGHLGFSPMGIRGAAIATLISRILEAVAAACYVLLKEKRLCWRVRYVFVPGGQLTRDFIRYGAPVIAGDFVWGINMFCQSMILGRLPEEAIAATSIMNIMSNMVYVWITGLCSAVGIITGKLVGGGETEKIRPYARMVQGMFLGVGVVSGLLVYALRHPFISLYNITPTAQGYAEQLVALLAVTIVGTCYQMTGLAGLVKAGGDTSFVFKNDTIFVFLVVLPSAWFALLSGAPVWVVMACLKCDQILKCFVAVVKINRFRWMKNLTIQEGAGENERV